MTINLSACHVKTGVESLTTKLSLANATMDVPVITIAVRTISQFVCLVKIDVENLIIKPNLVNAMINVPVTTIAVMTILISVVSLIIYFCYQTFNIDK